MKIKRRKERKKKSIIYRRMSLENKSKDEEGTN